MTKLLEYEDVEDDEIIDHDKYEYEYEYVENEDGELVEVPVRKKLKIVDDDKTEEEETVSELDLAAEFDLPEATEDIDDVEEEDKNKMIAELVAGILKEIIIQETVEAAIWKASKFLRGKLIGAALKQIQKEADEKAGSTMGKNNEQKKIGKKFLKKTKDEMLESGAKLPKECKNVKRS